MKLTKYKYRIKILVVESTNELESIMNEYGARGIRVTKIDCIESKFVDGKQSIKYTLYLEERIKK